MKLKIKKRKKKKKSSTFQKERNPPVSKEKRCLRVPPYGTEEKNRLEARSHLAESTGAPWPLREGFHRFTPAPGLPLARSSRWKRGSPACCFDRCEWPSRAISAASKSVPPGKQVAQRGLLIRACLASSVDRRSTAVAVFPKFRAEAEGDKCGGLPFSVSVKPPVWETFPVRSLWILISHVPIRLSSAWVDPTTILSTGSAARV